MEPPNEGRPPPGANGRGLRKNVGLGKLPAPAPAATGLENPQDEWMRPPQTAAYLKSSISTLAKQRLRGDGVPYSKLGRNVLYAKRDCDEYLASRRRLSTSEDTQ